MGWSLQMQNSINCHRLLRPVFAESLHCGNVKDVRPMSFFSRKPKSRIRVAVIGTGGMAHTHVKHFKGIEACEVVAGVNVDPIRLKAFRETHEIPKGFATVDA